MPKRVKMNYEELGLLHEMFVRQALKTPDHTAVVGADGRKMTFAELNRVSDITATYLRMHGVQVESIVGIYMEKSLDYVIAYIAILKAGE